MVTEYFFNFSYLFVWTNRKIIFPTRKNIFPSRNFFYQPEKIYFFQFFSGATLQKNNEISNQNNLLGLRKDKKYLENPFLS